MSRTDRHRPWRVQKADPYERHRWYRSWSGELYPAYRCCTCKHWYCWMGAVYQQERRRERHQARRLAREALKGGTWE